MKKIDICVQIPVVENYDPFNIRDYIFSFSAELYYPTDESEEQSGNFIFAISRELGREMVCNVVLTRKQLSEIKNTIEAVLK